MTHEIHEFKESKSTSKDFKSALSCPRRRSVLRMQEEIHINESEDYPIMETILKYI